MEVKGVLIIHCQSHDRQCPDDVKSQGINSNAVQLVHQDCFDFRTSRVNLLTSGHNFVYLAHMLKYISFKRKWLLFDCSF